MKRHVLLLCLVAVSVLFSNARGANPFFVLSNGIADAARPTPEAQAAALAELGCDGIGPSGTKGIPEMLDALDKHDLTLNALYVGANLDADKPKYDPGLPAAIKALEGRQTFVWLYIQSRQYRPSTTDGDARCVEIVREVAALAEQSGLRVALYPHVGFYVQRVEDAVRVVEKVDRDNVGLTFNLCHWLKLDEPESMRRLMELARPHLFVVTINGADVIEKQADRTWGQLIQPLGSGSFDVASFMRTLHQLNYTGPVGLQCYAVPGDKYENLKRSMAAWREMSSQLADER